MQAQEELIILDKNIVVYTEGKDDVVFWTTLLNRYQTKKVSFYWNVNGVTENIDAKAGVGQALKFKAFECLNHRFYLAIDSDMRYILQENGFTVQDFILQTYTYSWENHCCYASSALNNIALQATQNTYISFDFGLFLGNYSRTIFPLFVHWCISESEKDGNLTTSQFNTCIDLPQIINLELQAFAEIERLQHRLTNKIAHYNSIYTQNQYDNMVRNLKNLNILPENAYLHIQGHHLYDNIVSRILNQLCTKLQSNQYKTINNQPNADEVRKVYETYKTAHHFSSLLPENLPIDVDYWQMMRMESDIRQI